MEPQSWVEQLVPPTLHATAVLDEPVTVAVNCWVVPTTTLCVLGSTTTVTDFLPPPKPRRLLILQPAQEKQERTKRTVVSRRMPAPSQMPDEYAERWRNSVQSHTAMEKPLWGIGWMLAMWKEDERAKEIWAFET
jgi:hypothetical protein